MSGVAPVVFSVLSFAFVSPLPDGRREKVMFDKITSRISKLCYGLNGDFVDPVSTLPCLLSLFLPLPLPACLPPPPSLPPILFPLCLLPFSLPPSLPPFLLPPSGRGHSEGHQWSLQWSHNHRTRHTCCRDSCYHDNQAPGLCYPGCQDCCVQSAQGDQKGLQW